MSDARWYIGAMNDALVIIDRPPRPSNDNVWHDRPDGPTVILPTHPLTTSQVQAIVDAHNATANALPGYEALVEAVVAYVAADDECNDAAEADNAEWLTACQAEKREGDNLRAVLRRLRPAVPA